MASKFYAPGRDRAARVQALFARIAPRYDLLNDLQSFGLHRRWKRRVADLARAGPGDRALDVCCGTGDLAFALARRGALVTGLDFNEPMLSRARERGRGAGRVEFVQGDAMALPFADGSFEVVTVGYGLRNLSDWWTGLREMVRVARPGARLLVLDFGKPENGLWRAGYLAYLRVGVPLLGRVFCGNAAAYAYILESLKEFPSQRELGEAMRGLGLAKVAVVDLVGGVMGLVHGEKAGGSGAV